MSCYDGLRPDGREEAERLFRQNRGQATDLEVADALGD
jgi:hypothetical protein